MRIEDDEVIGLGPLVQGAVESKSVPDVRRRHLASVEGDHERAGRILLAGSGNVDVSGGV